MGFVQPGVRISDPQDDGGNRARLPGEIAAYAVPTTAQGRPGCPGFTCMPLCICLAHFSHSGPRVPAGARPSLVRPAWALTWRWESSPELITASEANRRASDREDGVKEAGNEAAGRRTGTGYEAEPSRASGPGAAKP